MAAAVSGVSVNMSGHLQNQLTRSLERILEDAYLSGELKLSGRKLKDFPKTGKYDLTDTVIADLSKNRFGDLPDELTSYLYLERLLLGHNAIRHVPDTVGSLQSLTYLDLSFNHLTELAREICLLPLEVLIVANNQLTSLPKEMGKMVSLAELDAGCNRIAHLPIAIGDLSNMRALNLRNNQLTLLPLQITYLRLEMLDVSCNCISSLPLELRMMTSLVILKLDHNPLVSPPTIVCMRGRVHIFRYLESMANRDSVTHRRHDDIRRSGKHSGPYGGYATPSPGAALTDPIRARTRHTVDSGYNTCDGEKRWSNDGGAEDACLMYPSGVTFGGYGISGGSGRSTPSTPSTLSPGSANLSRAQSLNSDGRNTPQNGHRISPDSNMLNGDDKTKTLNHQQTYRQYKEALRQQRQQDIYRPREQASPSDADILHSHHSPIHLPKHSQSTPHSPIANGHYVSALPSLSYTRNVSSNPSLSTATGFQAAISPLINGSPPVQSTPKRSQSPSVNGNSDEVQIRRPVQKVVPSRNVSAPNKSNGNVSNGGLRSTSSPIDLQKDGSYVKPLSPTKSPTSILHHGGISPSDGRYTNANGSEPAPKLLTTTVGYLKGANAKPPGSSSRLTWNKDVPPDKLSFTMKREFDKAKEESDLIHQLRSIIETRLKMTLPEDIAPVLTDGVVLCHLANHVRPRAVASVHVPSPAQPKLTMARCRRNVDNFLEACRKIGVEEAAVCRPEDVLLCADGSETERRQLLVAVARTAHALHRLATRAAVQLDPFCDEQDEEYRDRSFTEYEHAEAFYRDDRSAIEIARTADGRDDSRFVDDVDSVYNSSDSYRETSILQPKVSFRNRYDEERSVSNFNCFAAEGPKELDFQNFNDPTCNVTACDNSGSENSKITTGKVNKVTPIINVRRSGKLNGVGERIHQFNNYNRTGMKLRFQDNLNESLRRETIAEDEKNRTLVTALCLGSFFLSAILLYIFPLP